jgi:hypothetical protein
MSHNFTHHIISQNVDSSHLKILAIFTCYELVDLTDDPSHSYQSEDKVDIQEKKRPRVS